MWGLGLRCCAGVFRARPLLGATFLQERALLFHGATPVLLSLRPSNAALQQSSSNEKAALLPKPIVVMKAPKSPMSSMTPTLRLASGSLRSHKTFVAVWLVEEDLTKMPDAFNGRPHLTN